MSPWLEWMSIGEYTNSHTPTDTSIRFSFSLPDVPATVVCEVLFDPNEMQMDLFMLTLAGLYNFPQILAPSYSLSPGMNINHSFSEFKMYYRKC
jgi:hypothetical protein